jgi:hypothetical protein
MKEFEQFVDDALRIKFNPESENLSHQIGEASLSARYGKDPFLRTILNSTIGGPVPRGGVMASETTVVAAASEDEKDIAVTAIRDHLKTLLHTLQNDESLSRQVAELVSRLETLK